MNNNIATPAAQRYDKALGTPDSIKATTEQIFNQLQTSTSSLIHKNSEEDLTLGNFLHYQTDIKQTLLYMIGHLNFLYTNMTIENAQNQVRIQTNIAEIEVQCHVLEKYCNELKAPDIALPYKYLGSVIHTLKPIAGNIKELSTLQDTSEKNYMILKEHIKSTIHTIKKYIKKINDIDFVQSSLYTHKVFSPYQTSHKTYEKYINNTKGIVIKNTIPKETIIDSYEEIFEIVLDDLINNAIKFTPKGGEIEIGIKRENANSINFFVSDTGIGIPEGANIFSDKYTTPSIEGQQGTGLGLAHAKSYIEMMDGAIDYTKNTPQGTTFIFSMQKTPSQKDLQK